MISSREYRSLPYSVETINHHNAAAPPEFRDALLRLFAVGRENSLSNAKLADIVALDTSTLSKCFLGKYEVNDHAQIISTILLGIKPWEEKRYNTGGVVAHVSALDEIAEFLELAWKKRRIIFVIGDTQSGKTTAVLDFCRQHPRHPYAPKTPFAEGAIRYLAMPSGGALRGFLDKYAEACMRAPKGNMHDLKRRVISATNPHDLVIIDEFHQVFNPVNDSIRFATLEFIRELWNEKRFGLALVMTRIAYDKMQEGKFQAACAQLLFRSAGEIELPRVPDDEDLKLIAAAYGFPKPVAAEVTRIRALVQRRGLTHFTTILEDARDLAAAEQAKPAWTHFLQAHDLLARFAPQPH